MGAQWVRDYGWWGPGKTFGGSSCSLYLLMRVTARPPGPSREYRTEGPPAWARGRVKHSQSTGDRW